MKNSTTVDIPPALGIGGPLRQVTSSRGGRHYELPFLTDCPKLRSVTTLIDQTLRNHGLERWRESRIRDGMRQQLGRELTSDVSDEILGASRLEASASADLGTRVHEMIDALLRGEEVEVSDELEPAIQAWLAWRERFAHLEYIASEVGVWMRHPDMGEYAGTIDCLMRDTMNDELVIIDWKTGGVYESAMMQASAYVAALTAMIDWQQRLATEQNGHHQPTTIRAMIVQLVSDYPMLDGQKDRSSSKVFSGEARFAWVDEDEWLPAVEAAYTLANARKQRVVLEDVGGWV
jgi:hypothetical protein